VQALDQTGSIAESAFRIFRFVLQCLIFLVAIAAARWGIRTFLLYRGARTARWRNSFSAVSIAVLALLLLLRGPADRLLTGVGDAIARLRPESELGWLGGMLGGLYYVVVASLILFLATHIVGLIYWFLDKRIGAWQARFRVSGTAIEANPRFHASRVIRFCILLLPSFLKPIYSLLP
jgi:hypothetical protein